MKFLIFKGIHCRQKHAPVKFEILGFFGFSCFFRLQWKQNTQKTLLIVSFIALYLFVSIDLNHYTYF